MNRKQAGIGLGVGVAAFVGLIALSGQYVPPTGPLQTIQTLIVSSSAQVKKLTVTGPLYLTGDQTLTSTGTTNDLVLTDSVTNVVRWNGASAVTFTGFKCSSSANCASTDNGRIVIIDNVTAAQVMSFSNATGSVAANQLNLPIDASLDCPAKTRAVARYDSTLTKFVVVGGAGCYSRASNTLLGNPMGWAWQTGRYYYAPQASLTTSSTLGNGTLRVAPVYVPNTVTITRLGAEVATIGDVGSKVRLGIYADDGTGRPGSLVLDAGQIAGDSATVQELTVSSTIGPGWYWFGGAVQSAPGTQPTVRVVSSLLQSASIDAGTSLPVANNNAFGFSTTGVTGALPGTFGAIGVATTIPRLILKI